MNDSSNKEICTSASEEDGTVDYEIFSKSYSCTDIKKVKSKMIEFSNYLLGPARLSFPYASKSDCEELVFLILNMKKQLKLILTDLGKFSNKKDYSFCCCVCDDKMTVPCTRFWETIQNHEHVEELYCNFLKEGILPNQETNDYPSNYFEIELASVEDSSVIISNNTADEDSDGGVEETERDDAYNETDFLDDDQFDESKVNSFRFNFVPSYDQVVQSKLYPEKTRQSLKKFDMTIYPTILSVGPSRAACLICPSDLVSRSRTKMSKHFFLDHIAGKKHIKQTTLTENIEALINFHETWLVKEPMLQAHQVYFRPNDIRSFWCVLCNNFVSSKKVEVHILADVHKSRVLEIHNKNSKSYYLLDLHLLLYGITPKPDVKENNADASPKKNKEPNKNAKFQNDPKTLNKINAKDDTQNNANSQLEDSPHNIIKSIRNLSGETLLEVMPNRFKKHIKHFLKEGNIIMCTICKVKLTVDISQLILHIHTRTHLELSKIPHIAYNYYCEVCNLKIADEVGWLSHFSEASKRHVKFVESNKSNIGEYECTKCFTIIYGDEPSLSRHLYTKGVKRKPAEITLAPSVIKMFVSEQSIQTEAAHLMSEANNTLKCSGPTMECCKSVEKILRGIFDQCKIYPFGSRISGLGNQNSDLDLFLDIGDMYTGYTNQDSMSQIQIVKKVFGVLLRVKDQFEDLYQIPTARTPIVKFIHKNTGIDCDLSFRHGLSVENTRFLRYCFELQPISQALILILKKWSHQNNLSEYITTYALAIMAIFYLQTKRYLLPVKMLREVNQSSGLKIAGWETVGYTVSLEEMKKNTVPYSGNFVTLLQDFFLYYSKFPYAVDVICPLLGYTIKKKDFNDNGKNLPQEMKAYRAQLKGKDPEPFRNASPFCVQDPFDLSHNLTKALSATNLNKLRTLCNLSYDHIQAVTRNS